VTVNLEMFGGYPEPGDDARRRRGQNPAEPARSGVDQRTDADG